MNNRSSAEAIDKCTLAARALFRYRRSHDYWSPSVHAFWFWHSQQILRLIRESRSTLLQSESVGVDVGCGDGFLARKVANEFRFRLFIGIELDRDNAKIIDAENEFDPLAAKLVPVVGNVYAVPVADNAADLVICSEVVEHLTDDARAFAELHRILKPGGLLILATPNAAPLPHRLVWVLRGKRSAGQGTAASGSQALDSEIHGHINVQNAAYWRNGLSRAGFDLGAIRPVTPIYGRESLDLSPFKMALLMLMQALTHNFSWGYHFSEGLVISARKPTAA